MIGDYLEKDDAFAGDLNPLSTFEASHNIVQPDHVISCVFKTRTIVSVGAGRQRGFLRSPDPPDLILRILSAGGTAERHQLRFGLFREEILFLHLFSFSGNTRFGHLSCIQYCI